MNCQQCRDQLLDFAYDLLEPAEVEAVRNHLSGCAACTAATVEARRMQGLFATAAKTGFPNVSFAAPDERATPARPTRSTRSTWLNWVVAASLLLAVSAAGGPVLVNTFGYATNRPKVDAELAKVEEIRAKKERLRTEVAERKKDADEQFQQAQVKQDELERNWIGAETAAVKTLAEKPFLLDLTGPATAIAGAPNTYNLRVINADNTPVTSPVTVDATVKDAAGKELFARRFTTNVNERTQALKLPSGIWSKVAPGSGLYLTVSAVDKSGARSELTENLRLLEPLYTTFLTTDKPMYRPGEVVYFRSLTLDRTRFLPPEHDQTLRFEIKAPSGEVLDGSQLMGVTRPVKPDSTTTEMKPILGPDGAPIRGVGCGSFTLNAGLTGGEYTLNVYGVPTAGEPFKPAPLATRKFVINQYTPDKYLKKLEFDGKSYGPGDTVQAKLDVKDQGKPLADATIQVTAQADGGEITLANSPVRTDKDGTAAIKFTLPKGDELRSASVSVVVSTPVTTETLVRPIPLSTRKLTLEFFPEGGDLVAGVPNRVYFRATTSFGKPADVTGILTDGTADVTTLKTLTDPDQPGANQGLGVFEFTPAGGKTYAVKLSKPIGLIQPDGGYKLPDAKKDGLVLHLAKGVSKIGEPIRAKLHTTGQKQAVLVGAYIRGQAVAHQKVTVEPGKPVDVELNPGDVKLGGVTRITVFDLPDDDQIGRTDLKPLAERLVFRTPGESLKLSYTARKAGGTTPAGAFTPGSRIDLDIRSQDETGTGKAAVLWTAVVNQSVITMADEKTERMLPTHFLLSGEVKKGDELEHADFLLTDHAKASEALDLLLGTQGWRRFAEQNPEQFRQQVPAEELNRLQLVSSESGPIPTGWRPAIRRVFDEYWPKYEAGLSALELAERKKNEASNPDAELAQAESRYQQALAQFGETAVDLNGFDEAWVKWRTYLPVVFVTLGALVVSGLVLRQGLFTAGSPERRTLGWAVIVLLVLMSGIGLSALYTGSGNEKWRETWAVAPKPERTTGAVQDLKLAPAAKAGMPPPMAMEGGKMFGGGPGEAMPGDAAAGAERFAMEKAAPRPMAMRAMPVPAPAGEGGPGGAPTGRAGNPNLMRPARGGADDAKKKDQFDVKLMPGDPRGRDAKGPGNPRMAAPAKPMAPAADREFAPNGFAVGGRPGFRPEMFSGKPGWNNRFNQFNTRRYTELANTFAKSTGKQPQQNGQFNQVAQVSQFLPQGQPLPVREYAHTRPELSDDSPRNDFTETLLWQPVIVTPTDGKATVTFSLSDDVAPYRVLVAGHTLDGRIGATTGTIEVRKPFALDPKLPQEISSSDVLDIPVIGMNGTETARTADVTLSTIGLTAKDGDKLSLNLSANSGGRKLVRLTPNKLEGDLTVQLDGKAGGDKDSVLRTFTVVPDGFPVSGSRSDVLEQKVSAAFKVPEQVIPGTMKMSVSVYPNTLSEVQSGLEGMLREPYGCFEQTSTTNYPNVLILDYLNETNQAKPDVSKRAKDLLDRGYGKLTSFECQKARDGREGYEWFGGTAPPHEALTAYGLLQFTDMARVHPVDAEMLKRTKEYLLSTRDGKGGFKRNSRAIDTFGYAPGHITDAYIVWAITESERTADAKTDLDKEVAAIHTKAKEGDTAKDPYYLALVANALLNRGKRADGEAVLKKLAELQQKDGSIPGATTSITNSRGDALLIETTGMAVLGWIKANETGTYRTNVDTACKWIGTKRSGYGGYGSTQSTILALKALIAYARSSKRPAENGTVRVFANGTEVGVKPFTTEQTGPIVVEIADAEKVFKDGKADIRVETDAKQAYPCTVAWECRTRKPDSSAECPIKLMTTLNKNEVAEGDTVRLAVSVQNTKEKQNGMVTAIVGIPAGLKVPEDMKQLKALTERPNDGKRPTVSYWEKRGRELVFYWHGLNENEAIKFDVDLIAEIPGETVGPASRAYLYYGAEHKHWVEPVKVKVAGK